MSKPPRELNRRDFLETTALAAGALALGGCGDDATGTDTGLVDGGSADVSPDMLADADGRTDAAAGADVGPSPFDPVPVPDGFAAVAAVTRGDDVETSVRRAIALAGGIDAIEPGDSVFIKPNAVHSFVEGTPGIITGFEVLQAVIRIVKERDPGRIVVGDRSSRPFESDDVFDDTGMGAAALAAGADEVYGAPRPRDDEAAWRLMQPTGWEETWLDEGGILAMEAILEADHFINMPVLKDHRWAVFSLAMKNLIGAIGDDSRDPMHYTENEPDRLSRDIAILNVPFSPLINIIDGTMALVNGGPEGILSDALFTTPGVILASSDRVAIDALGVAFLKRELSGVEVTEPDDAQAFLAADDIWSLPQIVHGIDLGLGVGSADDVELPFDGVEGAEALEALFRA